MPAVDIRKGKCVQLVGGKPGSEWVAGDPLKIALGWQRMGAGYLHLIDLDAALGEGNNTGIIREILEALDIPAQVGGGIRTTEQVAEYLNYADRVIVGTRGALDMGWMEELAKRFPSRIVAAADARGEEIWVRGWTEGSGVGLFDFARGCKEAGLAALLYTDIDREGQLKGINVGPIKRLVDVGIPLMVAGGISSIDDLLKLKGIGVHAAVLGMAIYKYKIDLIQALRI